MWQTRRRCERKRCENDKQEKNERTTESHAIEKSSKELKSEAKATKYKKKITNERSQLKIEAANGNVQRSDEMK